ncbi:hypothetical protein NQZ68_007126 [Dissostichus eleginoides]|nr:hypothetical protein NQZ68_007126 [Dissostichus eleginoides]
MSTTASSASVEQVGFVLSSRLFGGRSRTQFVDQQERSCGPLIKADWGLGSVSRPSLFGIITPVVQGLIPAETWERGTKGLQRSGVEREEGRTVWRIPGLWPHEP